MRRAIIALCLLAVMCEASPRRLLMARHRSAAAGEEAPYGAVLLYEFDADVSPQPNAAQESYDLIMDGTTWGGGAEDFDGTNDKGTTSNPGVFAGADLAVGAWVYVSSFGDYTQPQLILAGDGTTGGGSSDSSFKTEVYRSGNYVARLYIVTGAWSSKNLAYTLDSGDFLGSWHHLFWTFSDADDEIVFYYDGSPVATNAAATGSMRGSTSDVSVGEGVGSAEPWNGKMDRVFVGTTALDAAAVSDIYDEGRD